MPQEGPNLDKIEKLLRDFTKKLPGMQQLNYWERLKSLKMNSGEKENGKVPNTLCMEDIGRFQS